MKLQILVVDDEPAICDLLAEYFQRRGYSVITAGSVEEATEALTQHRPDLTILDLDLAGVDGLEYLSFIKHEKPEMPVIILTGMGYDDDLLSEAVQKGAAGYVTKTLPLEQLLMEVHRILNLRQP